MQHRSKGRKVSMSKKVCIEGENDPESQIIQGLQQETLYNKWDVKKLLLDSISPWGLHKQQQTSRMADQVAQSPRNRQISIRFLGMIGSRSVGNRLRQKGEIEKLPEEEKKMTPKLPLIKISEVQLPQNEPKIITQPSLKTARETPYQLKQTLLPSIGPKQKKCRSCVNLRSPMAIIEEHKRGRKRVKGGLLDYGMLGESGEVSERVLNYWNVNHSKRN